MFSVLHHHRIPEVIVNAISVLYNKSKSAVMVGGNISGPFQVTTGVLQGNAQPGQSRRQTIAPHKNSLQ